MAKWAIFIKSAVEALKSGIRGILTQVAALWATLRAFSRMVSFLAPVPFLWGFLLDGLGSYSRI
jgi:hypothetical protein